MLSSEVGTWRLWPSQVNLSVDNTAVTTAEASPTVAVKMRLWPVVTGLALFPAVQFGVAARSPNLVLSFVASVAAYILSIYLYRKVTQVACSNRLAPLLSASLLAMVIAGLVVPNDQFRAGLAYTAMIPAAGIVTGWWIRKSGKALSSYLAGAGVVVLAGLIMYGPDWSLLISVFKTITAENAQTIEQTLISMGYHADAAATYSAQLQRAGEGMSRLIPAASVLSLVTPFTVGFLWFLIRGAESTTAEIKPFHRWKVPFGFIPAVLVAAAGRLLGGETIVLAADNVLLALSICFCVGGLSLVEHSLRKLKMRRGLKVAFYIMLTLAGLTPLGLIGYVINVLLGFIDSFADWRKVSGPPIELETK